jgi:hypothetical protein
MEGSLVAYKVFSNGSVLNASEINDNLMNQSVAVFSNAAARTAAISSPVEGQMTYLEDVDRYDSYSGSAWLPVISPGAWTLYTPTFTGLTLGNGTLVAKYTIVGKTMFFSVSFTLGSTSAVGTAPEFSFPSGITSSTLNNGPVGIGTTNSIAGTRYPFWVYISGGLFAPRVLNAAGTYLTHAAISSTVPFTWTTGNAFILSGQTEID